MFCHSKLENSENKILLPPLNTKVHRYSSTNIQGFRGVSTIFLFLFFILIFHFYFQVLECLTEIASIFGENVILLQYLPYAWDLISLCKKRLTPNLEGGLIGCVSMVHHMIPFLNDSVLMNELTENFMNRLLFPVSFFP